MTSLSCASMEVINTVIKFKLLGIFISSDLSWDTHYIYILQKVAKRMYSVIYLFKAGVPVCDILCLLYCNLFY